MNSNILIFKEGFSGYCFLIGYVTQKRPLDYILMIKERGINSKILKGINEWLLNKHYPSVVPMLNLSSVESSLEMISGKDGIMSNLDLPEFMKNCQSAVFTTESNTQIISDYANQWDWDKQTLLSILNLSDINSNLKNLISTLEKRKSNSKTIAT